MADLTVTEGDAVVVEHETTNFGDAVETQDIDLEVDNAVEDTNTNVELEPEETYRGQLVWKTTSGDAQANDYDVCVVADTEDCITVNVNS